MAYPRYSWAVREAWLARVAAGERVTHVGRDPAMPCCEAVTGWARADPGFAARVAEAKALGAMRRSRLSDAVMAEILRRLGEGEAIGAILRSPGMPSKAAYAAWRRADGEFGGEVWRINKLHREGLRERIGAARVRAFDRALADRVIVRVGQGAALTGLARLGEGLPGPRTIARWRREDAAFDSGLREAFRVARARARHGRRCPPELMDAIAARVLEGATLAEVARDRAMPSRGALYGWMRTLGAFRQSIDRAREMRGEWLADQALAAVERPGWERGRPGEVRALMRKADRITARARRDA